jgi:hypothetical protein
LTTESFSERRSAVQSRVIRPALLCLFLAGLSLPAGADDALARLKQDLARGPSATEVLSHWCGDLHFADPPQIHAEQAPEKHLLQAGVRELLKVSLKEPIGYRRVRLTCGGHVLSEADNWYVPSRLTPAMNQTLDTSDTPFGTVVKPLGFHRVTLSAQPMREGRTVFRVRALLLTPENQPISLVLENYQQALLGR